MGDRSWPCETTSHAGDHGLHVWKLAADFLHNDGFHAVGICPDLKFLVLTINQVQRPNPSHLTNQRRLRQIR